MDEKAWFASWFDTDYYHLLYKDRDLSEAKSFVGNLCNDLQLPKGSKVLDLACGKGRHSRTLHSLGYQVTGADLSENSISAAQECAEEGLQFIVHDMRDVIPNLTFDAVFNIFTSFGYFDDSAENEKVIRSVHTMLEEQGLFVIDFMNAEKVIRTLEPPKKITKGGIDFHIAKNYNGKHILKEIRFEDKGQSFHYTERVQALKMDDFRKLLTENGFEILRTFGDFDLHPFDVAVSDRLILIAKKR
ncbi:MAG: class I SAM-dependent methyltransferase [bacterium]|nr:class I SAM-dependent methyltransferase [bacterium]